MKLFSGSRTFVWGNWAWHAEWRRVLGIGLAVTWWRPGVDLQLRLGPVYAFVSWK